MTTGARLLARQRASTLLGSLLLVALLAATIGGAGLAGLDTMQRALQTTNAVAVPRLVLLLSADRDVSQAIRYTRGAIIATSTAQSQMYGTRAQQARADAWRAFRQYRTLAALDADLAALTARAATLFARWLPLDARVQRLGVQNTAASNAAGIALSLGAERRVTEPLARVLTELVHREQAAVRGATAAATAAHDGAVVSVRAVTVLALLAVALLQGLLWLRDARVHALAEHASDLVSIVDRRGTLRYASPSHQRLLGYPPAALRGRALEEIVHPEDRIAVQRALADPGTETPPVCTVEVRLRTADGAWRTVELIGNNRLRDPAVRGVVVNARDITERVAAEAALAHQARHDALTGLPNRTLFQERVAQALTALEDPPGAGAVPTLAVLLLDLDGFKEINDTHGHAQGDQLLQQVAERLRTTLRASDTVARLGGDEFAVLLPATGVAGAAGVAQALREALEQPVRVEGAECRVGVSIGVALAPPQGDTWAALVQQADRAMYAAKRAGSGVQVAVDEDTPLRRGPLTLVPAVRS